MGDLEEISMVALMEASEAAEVGCSGSCGGGALVVAGDCWGVVAECSHCFLPEVELEGHDI